MGMQEDRRWRHQGGETRSLHLTVDAELVAEAQAMNIDLAAVLEDALRVKLSTPHSEAEAETNEPAPARW